MVEYVIEVSSCIDAASLNSAEALNFWYARWSDLRMKSIRA